MTDNGMARRHTLWQRIGAWWRHLGTPKHVSQGGSGGLGTDDATVGGEGSVVVGRNVYGDIYQVYQSAPGHGVLTREAFDRILEAYLHWVKGAHGQTRLWGVEVLNRGHVSAVRNLSTVFVPLTLRRFQPLRREEVEALARHTQDDHLHAYLRLAEERSKAGETMALSSLLSLQDRLAIIGGAGSGKSTILAHLALQLATAALTGATAPGGLALSKTALIPLVIPLRYFLTYRRSPPEPLSTPRHGTLAGFIPWYFAKYASPVGLSADFFDRLLLGGGCLLMLDGLDEIVSGPERGWVKQQIEDLASHIYPGNRVMVTAREAGYRDNAVFGDDFLRVDVQDLDEDQIQVLVANWCAQLYPGEETQRTQELLSAIHDINNLRTHRELPPLINTPLMTTMVVSVKWGETELPRERAKLYEAAVKVILRAQYLHDDPERIELEKWGGSWEEQRDCLAILALAMHGEGRSGAVVTQARICEVLGQKLLPDNLESFLQAIRLRGGLLEERADLFQFAHLTFQEFLAAHWLAKQRDAAFPVLQPHLTDSWWREVFLLTYGVARVDFEPFAQQYLTWLSSQTVDGEARLAGLELAGSALLELEKPDPKTRRQQVKGLVEALGDPHLVASGGLRARAGNTLARLGDLRFRGDAWYLPAEPLLGFVEIGAGPFLMASDKAHDPEAYDNNGLQRSSPHGVIEC